MRRKQNHTPRRAALLALALGVTLAGCETIEDLFESNALSDAGFEKVANRTRDPLPPPSRPDPPPAVAMLAGGGEVPELPAGTAPAGVTQEMVEEGARLYGTSCAACHGAGGAGSPAAPPLDDADWIHVSGGYDEIVGIIRSGVPAPRQFPAPMPPLGGGSFDEEQVRAIGAYVFALSRAGAT